MVTKKLTYTDYFGNKRTEDFMFNFTKEEVIALQVNEIGGMAAYLNKIITAQDQPTIYNTMKKVVLKSYGVISPDGRRFEKSEQLSKEFSETEAFSDLMVTLTTDDNAAANFINELIPQKMVEEIQAKFNQNNAANITAMPVQ